MLDKSYNLEVSGFLYRSAKTNILTLPELSPVIKADP
jgi:hypothetical protein